LGQCVSGYDTRILGVTVSLKADTQIARVRELAASTARMLVVKLEEGKILVDDRFLGLGYAIPSEEGENAVRLSASTEGAILPADGLAG
jgi:D-cysteine desulfhydrase